VLAFKIGERHFFPGTCSCSFTFPEHMIAIISDSYSFPRNVAADLLQGNNFSSSSSSSLTIPEHMTAIISKTATTFPGTRAADIFQGEQQPFAINSPHVTRKEKEATCFQRHHCVCTHPLCSNRCLCACIISACSISDVCACVYVRLMVRVMCGLICKSLSARLSVHKQSYARYSRVHALLSWVAAI